METLANKYRPKDFDSVIGQDVTITILKNQIEKNSYSHSILFAGNAGCGKTTCAKILANMIDGEIFSYDCASHNGVAEMREIISNARIPSLIHKYKIFILDECHTLSSSAWPALLMTLEENLPTSIFIFCTTDTAKIPNTIISRLQRFNFMPISTNLIEERLKYVCKQENIDIEDAALNSIAKSAEGGLRQALTNLDKCLMYGDLSLENVQRVLNIVSDDIFDKLYDAISNNDRKEIIRIIEDIYNNGYELHLIVKQFLDYLLDNIKDLKIIDTTMTILQDIKYESYPKNLIIARYITVDV